MSPEGNVCERCPCSRALNELMSKLLEFHFKSIIREMESEESTNEK